MAKPFNGVIDVDIRDSTADWDAFLADKAPDGAPNVLVVLYDDTGCAAWSPYGGRIEMPTLQRLADNGVTYSQWHTTALCSPTRSVFLTGRNHHQNGFASISETSTGFPGYNSHIPPENATPATVLRDAGWSTFWVGKNHNTPVDAWTMGSSKKLWPLGLGYDRFYGFVGGETNQWFPDLAEDNHYIEQPYLPEDEDLADKALEFIPANSQAVRARQALVHVVLPGRQPRSAPRTRREEYIEKTKDKGKLDDGYEATARWVLPRMIEKGHPARGHGAHADQPDDPRDVQRGRHGCGPRGTRCRMTRSACSAGWRSVYAAFSEYTDDQVGRIVRLRRGVGPAREHGDHVLRRQRRIRRGLSPNGSVNENKFFNALARHRARTTPAR